MNIEKIDPYKPCPCGSGRKYKFCCHAKVAAIGIESPRALVKRSVEFPVSQCAINADWQDQGLATIFVVRQLSSQRFMFGSYLVDSLCLGLKNTFCNANLSGDTIQRMISAVPQPMERIDYEDARSLILGGIEYARKLGFEPDQDFEDSQHLIEPARPFSPKYEFGRDGKPLYVPGPNDDPMEILSKLGKH